MVSETSEYKHDVQSRVPEQITGQMVIENIFFLSESAFKQARENEYDIIIVGSGFCSLAVTERALRNDPTCRILILERGTFFLPEHVQNLPLPFSSTMGGLSESFPWTVSAETASGEGIVRWQHGIVPFFGGRSTMWSAWCPRPTTKEMHEWPKTTVKNVRKYFQAAENLLHVQKTSDIYSKSIQGLCEKPVYGKLQKAVSKLMKRATNVKNVYRAEAASLASDGKNVSGIDFKKFSVPGKLLELVSKQADMHQRDAKYAPLHIATSCTVEKIHHEHGKAVVLRTSRGFVHIGEAQLVLAMGALPPTTLVHNSFPQVSNVGEHFSAHFISAIYARIPRRDLEGNGQFGDLEIGAFYIAGTAGGDYRKQFHIQMSVLSDKDPGKNAQTAFRYMPDVVATASMQQLNTSKDYVVCVCAVLGELDLENENNGFRHNHADSNVTANSILHVSVNENDKETWDAMDEATFDVIEKTLSPRGPDHAQYWHGPPDTGKWCNHRPSKAERRVESLVHASSTLRIGKEDSAPVDLNYRLRGTDNVYITGGGLWPYGGSWNPTMVMVAMAQHLADLLTLNGNGGKEKEARTFDRCNDSLRRRGRKRKCDDKISRIKCSSARRNLEF